MQKKVKRFVIVMIVIAVIFPLFLFAYHVLREAIKIGLTQNRVARIHAALGRALGKKPLAEYHLATEILEQFPEVSVTNGRIVDEWGRPIIVTIERFTNVVWATVTSAGPDGKTGTKDDIVRKLAWVDQCDLLETIEDGTVLHDPLMLKQ